MMSLNRFLFLITAVIFNVLVVFTEVYAEQQKPLADVMLDRSIQNMKQGAETTLTTCLACHGLKYVNYRHLRELGFIQEELDRLRAGKPMESPLVSQVKPEQLQAAFGMVPPDLSLIAAARPQGSRYIYSMLTGFYKTPDGSSTDNHIFPGIRMPDVLGYASVSDHAERTNLQSKANAVTVFLEWAADPHAIERVRLGYFVMAYLIFLTILLYLIKNRVWQQINSYRFSSR
jgi:ubiquinol-cytochrome c reductase cytochrome c1 subunit